MTKVRYLVMAVFVLLSIVVGPSFLQIDSAYAVNKNSAYQKVHSQNTKLKCTDCGKIFECIKCYKAHKSSCIKK